MIRTRAAVASAKLELDHVIVAIINRWRPTDTLASCWTGCLLGFPINHKVLGVEAFPCPRLLTNIAPGWSEQVHPIFLVAIGKQLGINIAHVHQMCPRQQVLFLQRFVNTADDRAIRNRSSRCFDVGNKMRLLVVAGFSQVNLVSDLGGTPLSGIMRVNIIGRTEK